MTRLAAHPQKAMVQQTTFEEILEFALHIARRFPALLRQMSGERRVVFFDDLIEKSLLGRLMRFFSYNSPSFSIILFQAD